MNSQKISSWSSIKITFSYIKESKKLLIFVIFISLISSTAIILSSIFVGQTLNLLISYTNGDSENGSALSNKEILNIVYASLITIGLYIIYWLTNTNILIWSVKLSYTTGSKIRYAVFTKLLSVPISFIDKNKVGELMARATNDIDMMITNLVQNFAAFLTSPFIILASLITIFIISPLLSAISIAIMAIIFLSTFIFAKLSSKNFIKMQDKLGELNAINEEFLINKFPIYVFNRKDYAMNKFNKVNSSHQKHTYKAEYKMGMVFPILDLLENIAYGLIYTLGFIFILLKIPHGGFMELNLGTLATFVVIVRLANGEIGNLARFGSIIEKLFACFKRIYSLINEEDDVNLGKKEIKNLNGDIEFQNVSFSYVQGKPIIKNLNLYIKQGQKVAIVGPTGSGKTTLINLLMRFYETDEGKILINGIDIKDIDKNCLRRYISVVLQETSLFSESIKTNISYGHHQKPNINKIIESSKEIGSYHYIALLDNGFDTVIKDNSSISSGEAQLLALTRAHYSPSNILILDEATSNIDSKTEYDVQQGMIKLMKDKTTFVIAHRLSTIVNSDLILVMKDGIIVEKGNHFDLIKKQGLYFNLYTNHSLENDD